MRRHGWLWGLVSLAALGAGLPARAAPAVRVDVQQRSLSKALTELAREARVELLYNEALVRDMQAPPVRGRMRVEQALSALLAGTGVGYRVTPAGVYVLFALPPAQRAAAAEPAVAVAELLVIGHRTQNVDIRRTVDDIQAYRITTREDLALSQHTNVEQLMHGREPADAQVVPPSQNVVQLPGSTRSEIDLRGLGPQRTLVLVDGRRMPNLPSGSLDFDQADLNGVPLGAVERIETLTSTAGGIYGPSAIGGVVNLVLRRDYRGAGVSVRTGMTDRGDAGRVRLEGRIGFTPDDGATDVMLFGAYADSQPLPANHRDFEARSRLLQFTNDQAGYLANLPPANAILVASLGEPLRLDPQYGGAELPSQYTYLPLDFVGSDAERATALVRNAGNIVLDLPPEHAGELGYLLSNPRVASGIINVRHRFSDHVEAYFDALYFTNHGTAERPHTPIQVLTQAGAPNNPFDQAVSIRFPSPDFFDVAETKVRLSRFTVGVIASLPKEWRMTADVALGAAGSDLVVHGVAPDPEIFNARRTGLPSPSGRPALAPLGPFDDFRAALAAYGVEESLEVRLISHFSDASVRASGPLFNLPGGPVTATLLVEGRREHVPESKVVIDAPGIQLTSILPIRTQTVASAYAEARVPVAPESASLFLLRGLELQLAVRNDYVRTTFPEDSVLFNPTNDRLFTVSHDATVFTAGARFLPQPWLMLRGSIATGQLPPNINQLQSRSTPIEPRFQTFADPRRGGELVGQDAPAKLFFGGAHDISPEEGRTVSVGAVLNPLGRKGPRVSVDFSRITTDREVVLFPLSAGALLAAEATYPDRVVRGPLTQADIDRGFSAGPVIALNTRMWNAGRTVVDSIDVQGEWTIATERAGEFRAYGTATWLPDFRSQLAEGGPSFERVGFYNGPLEWRGNAGLRWTRGSLSMDFNVQYYHSYRVIRAGPSGAFADFNARMLRNQGTDRIPAQAYVDLIVRKRLRINAANDDFSALEVSLGVQNLFDHSPPIVAETDNVGYSTYGDPRRRRFELGLAATF